MDLSKGSPQIALDLSSMCTNNCNNNGNCTRTGVCNCKKGFSGFDCSQDENAKAILRSSTINETWDLSTGELKDVILISSKFLSSNPNSTIKYTAFVS